METLILKFLAMFPASGRLLREGVKNRSFKWPSFMQHELTQTMSSRLSCQETNKNSSFTLHLSQTCHHVFFPPRSEIPGQIPQLSAYLQVLENFSEIKNVQSNQISKLQSPIQSLFPSQHRSVCGPFYTVKCLREGWMFKISGTHTDGISWSLWNILWLISCKTLLSCPWKVLGIPSPHQASLLCGPLKIICATLHSIHVSHRRRNTPFPAMFSNSRHSCPLASLFHSVHLQPSSCLLISLEKNQAPVWMLLKP